MIKYLPYSTRTPDTQYRDLLGRILKEGRKVLPIHGEPAYTITGLQFRFEMANGFPLFPIRDLRKSFPGALGELIAFMHGARTLESLKEFGCPKVFWERWVTKEKCAVFGLPEHDLGPGSYGPGWTNRPALDGTHFNQLEHLLRQIKERPFLRTHVLDPWIPGYTLQHSELTRRVVVAPCHGWVHFLAFPESRELEVHHFQRSGDMPVGVALNLVEYAALGMLVAHMLGYTFVRMVHTVSDAHIYESQVPSVLELIAREPRRLPTVTLDMGSTEPMDARREHFALTDYEPHEHMVIPTPT